MRPRHCDAFNIEHGMEQTSMTNAIKKRLNRKGFTLAEVLVTVAIIIILAGVTFVSVAQYQKNLRLMEMDGTAKEIFIAAQNHLSVAKASGDLDRLAANASATGTTDSTIGTKLSPAPSYAGNASGEYYYVIHNVMSGTESCTPQGSDAILQMMLPFGALDETVSVSGNYAIVYELKSASVVAVLYSGAGNASFGNTAVINLEAADVNAIPTLYNDKSARKSYKKGGVTAIVGCYTGTAGSAAIPTETLEAPKLEVKNENKLHVLVREANNTDNITLVITGEQSGTTARRLLNRNTGDGYTKTSGTFDVTLDDITGGDGVCRFCQLITGGRFKPDVDGSNFIPGENIIISAIASSSTALATPKESAKYTVSSLFDDVNETTNSTGDTKVYIKNLRHLENLGANVSGFTAALRKDTTPGNSKVVNITAEQKNNITMFSFDGLHDETYKNIYGSGTFASTYIAANVGYPLSYDGGSHEIYDLKIAGYHADGVEANAGIFGTVTSTLSVKNLVLRNDKIPKTSTSANAGMLLGKTSADLTVDGVLAYYHEDEYNSEHDSAVEVQASQVAGGLIGLVDGGKLSVKNSAAAVYVKGGSAAGGFIGNVSGVEEGSTIVQSYAGGHTKDGAYSTTDAATSKPVLTGAGRYNVQASGNAGGFIGESSDKVTMNAVYSTASAYSDDAAKYGSFSGTTNVKFATGNNYYAIGPHNGTDASADDTARAEITTGQVRRQATPYDRKLILKGTETEHKTMDKTSYPLCTVRNLCEEDTSIQDTDLPWFIKEHVGDWVVSKKTTGKLEIKNDVRLELDFTTSDTSTKTIFFTITGVTSQKTLKLMMDVTADNGKDVSFATHVVENGKFNTYWNTGSKKMEVRKTEDGASYKFILYLDDITTKGGHFADLTNDAKLIVGEDLKITVSECTIQDHVVTNIHEIAEDTVNSLYDHVNWTTGTAYISSARHLENLDERVSGINKKESVEITQAVLMNDIVWKKQLGQHDAGEDGFVEKIKITTIDPAYENKSAVCAYTNGEVTTDGCFVPITNSKLQSFDGQNHTLTNMDIYWLNDGDHHTGLFGQVSTGLNVCNLALNQVKSVCEQQAFSAAVIGKVETGSSETEVKLQNITITGDCTVEGDSNTSKASGGLIGEVTGDNTAIIIDDIKIQNGNLNVSSIQSWGGHAGGIIGNVDKPIGSMTLKNVHITSPLSVKGGEHAGGFIGNSNGSTSINNSSIENANVKTVYNYAGGLIGEAAMATTIDQVTAKNIVVQGLQQNDAAIGGAIGITRGETKLTKTIVQNVTVTSQSGKAGGLIGEAKSEAVKVNIDNTHLGGFTSVSGINHAGGMIGYAYCNAYLQNVSIDIGEIKASFTNNSPNDRSVGGFIGFVSGSSTEENPAEINAKQKAAVSNAVISGNLKVEAVEGNNYSMNPEGGVGGVIGYGNASVAINEVSLESTGSISVSALGESAGGVLGAAKETVSIKNIQFEGPLTVSGRKEVGGLTGGNANKEIKIANAALLSDALIVSSEGDAGGVIGHAKNGVNITNTKVVGTNTEIIAGSGSGNAGGLIGGFENSLLTINHSAVSAFVNAEGGNAGGLIGLMTGQTSGSKIENSYYGGRTKAGAYGAITVHERSYEANIVARYSAGGLIGSVGANPFLALSNCYSTGSVKTKEGTVGGFIGYIGKIEKNNKNNISLSQCYSMGKVLNDSNVKGGTGGFIGQIAQEEPKYENVYYLNAFDLSSVNAVGTLGNSKKSKISVIKDPSQILGKPESHDLTTIDNTKNYDETLNDQAYPYKNWTKSGDSATNPIAYYGDWPLPNKQLNGRIVYYHRISGDNTEGEFTLTGYDTSLTTKLRNLKGNFEGDGFAIICETPNRKDAHRKYMYADKPHDSTDLTDPNDKDYLNMHDGYIALTVEGSDNNVECAPFVWEDGKTYYFFRFTNITLPETGTMTVYFRGNVDTIYSSIIYKADINVATHTATFTRIE